MAIATFTKDPDSNLDYTLDWSSWLGNDEIDSVVYLVPAGITKTNESHTTKTSTVWLSGGTVGVKYEITHRITTVGGLVDDRSFRVSVSNR